MYILCEAAEGDLWVALGIYYRTHKFNVFAPNDLQLNVDVCADTGGAAAAPLPLMVRGATRTATHFELNLNVQWRREEEEDTLNSARPPHLHMTTSPPALHHHQMSPSPLVVSSG